MKPTMSMFANREDYDAAVELHEKQEADSRKRFEAWISAPPFKKDTYRFSRTNEDWPGQYVQSQVELAWQAWQESKR